MGVGYRGRLQGWPLACVEMVRRVLALQRPKDSWSQKLIELGNFRNDLAHPRSSEIVLQGEPFFIFHPLEDQVE